MKRYLFIIFLLLPTSIQPKKCWVTKDCSHHQVCRWGKCIDKSKTPVQKFTEDVKYCLDKRIAGTLVAGGIGGAILVTLTTCMVAGLMTDVTANAPLIIVAPEGEIGMIVAGIAATAAVCTSSGLAAGTVLEAATLGAIAGVVGACILDNVTKG